MMLRCPINFQGHRSNFKVTGIKSLSIFGLIQCWAIGGGRSTELPCFFISVCNLHLSLRLVCGMSEIASIMKP